MKDLYFVTSNKNKIKEAENILQTEIKTVDLDLDEIQEIEVEAIVKDKAHKAYDSIKKPVFVEDTGLYIEEWNGFPGALIKWVLKTLGNKGLCNALQSDNRTITAKTCVCLYDGENFNTFCGEIKGKIPRQPQGKSGFGWDPIFQPDGHDETFAEMNQEEKNEISMRKIALKKMKNYLDKK